MAKTEMHKIAILGAGITGLSCGYDENVPIFEAKNNPGGICTSYYMSPRSGKKSLRAPTDAECYRFEIGGGHWIFGGDPQVHNLINSLAKTKSYVRSSAVYFPETGVKIPYPIQNNLRFFKSAEREKILKEIRANATRSFTGKTMAEWLEFSFGRRLFSSFFYPFNKLYTAGLLDKIAPQDSYKSPIRLEQVEKGANNDPDDTGYNATFIYPADGLDALISGLALRSKVNYGKEAVRIDTKNNIVIFKDGTSFKYHKLISTLPLNKMISLTGIEIDEKPNPSPSVLVINIGAKKGPSCPQEQWLYIPASKTGFHRVGFYSNVDVSFLPKSDRKNADKTSIYVEKSYPEGKAPNDRTLDLIIKKTIDELQSWNWISEVEVADPTWIEVAYTWQWPGSQWRDKALEMLEEKNIFQIGRYARWNFQGIADSIRDGMAAKKFLS